MAPGPKEDDSLWWQAEKLHQWVCQDYQKRKSLIFNELQKIQNSFIVEEEKLLLTKATVQELEFFSNSCLEQVKDFYERNIQLVSKKFQYL